MPRRRKADPLALAVGRRIRVLRRERGLTLEKLAYESGLDSKGYLSDIEHGRALPSLTPLQVIADRLEVDLLDLVCFPDEDDRQRVVELTRRASKAVLRQVERLLPTG